MKIKSFLGGIAIGSVVTTHLLSAYPIFTAAIGLDVPDGNWLFVYIMTIIGIITCWAIVAQMDDDHADLVRLRRKCNEPNSTTEALRWELEDEDRQRYEQWKLENGEE